MSQLTLADIKRHVQALDFTADDDLLQDLQEAAEEFVQKYIRRDLDTDLPDAWPLGCTMAVKMLVAVWYRDREASVPTGVRDMLAPHRNMG